MCVVGGWGGRCKEAVKKCNIFKGLIKYTNYSNSGYKNGHPSVSEQAAKMLPNPDAARVSPAGHSSPPPFKHINF